MNKVAEFPLLSGEERKKIDPPRAESLVRKPDRYRYELVRFKVHLFEYMLWSENNDVNFNPAGYWPEDKLMYRLHVKPVDGDDDSTLVLYCSGERFPKELPRPSKVKDGVEGKVYYSDTRAPVFTVVGMFYKLTSEGTKVGETALMPNLMVWQFVPETPAVEPVDAETKRDGYRTIQTALGVFICAVALVLGYLWFLKKKVLPKVRRENSFQGYTPMRDVEDERRERRERDEREADGPVDPDLVAAARGWRTDHGLSTDDTLEDIEDEPKDEPDE